jgi:hypothetical protein
VPSRLGVFLLSALTLLQHSPYHNAL